MRRFIVFLSFILMSLLGRANDPAYLQRQQDYTAAAVSISNNNALILQAKTGVPVNMSVMMALAENIPTKGTVDFDLVILMRVLCLSNGLYADSLLPHMLSVPYWVNYGDTLRGYWSENHMIMWMSTDWLLHERFGKPIDNRLRTRLVHYLHLKNDYGFYEFFSPVYAPYCLSGLLNLADFSQDAEIKSLAQGAAQRLLSELLLLTNDQGVFFPVAGRSYPGKYESPYGQNHNHLIWLLSGMGEIPNGVSHSGAFLATSDLEVAAVSQSWTSEFNGIYRVGHSLDSLIILCNTQASPDREMFQWSCGGYFHPLLAQNTAQLLRDSAMWDHVDFEPFRQLKNISPAAFPTYAELLSVASKSTLICGQDIALFKNRSVTLSSVQDFFKGKLGYQQHPIMANIVRTAVYTGSGEVFADWTDRTANNANEHLPYIKQQGRVAMLMYRPEPKPAVLPFINNEVALHWSNQDFSEIREDSLWIFGRVDASYVAVRRHCNTSINGVRACEYTTDGQTWIFIVGDSSLDQSFDQFQAWVSTATITENNSTDASTGDVTYFASITLDTINIAYAWNAAAGSFVDIPAVGEETLINVFPNPCHDVVQLITSGKELLKVELTDLKGRSLMQVPIDRRQQSVRISVGHLQPGTYLLRSIGEQYTAVKKIIIQ